MGLPFKSHPEHGLASLGGEPHVFHCHHYNCFLQTSIAQQSALVDAASLLSRAGAEVVTAQLRSLSGGVALAEEIFSTLGFGKLTLGGLGVVGGEAAITASHYAMGWLSKFGGSSTPVCLFPAGFIEAAARAAFKGSYEVREVECLATGAKQCRFTVTPSQRALGRSPGLGQLATFGARPAAATKTSVDEAAIMAACAKLPLSGDVEGRISAFGVSLTRHYANYYNLLSYRFDQQMFSLAGEAAALAARMLLIEAGHVCAFHTFGGIMQSAEWDALIAPQCETREDWAYGLTAVVNALGWGRWSIADLQPGRRLEMQVDGSYESNGYLGMFGKSDSPRCYLATGGVAGLMNLLYNADITTRPQLTPEFYTATFKSPSLFVGREVECRTMGAPACRVVAERIA